MQLHLHKYGLYLHVKDQMFELRWREGQTLKKEPFAAHKIKSVWIGEGVSLSFEAVRLSLKHNVDLVFLENNGNPLGRIWHSKLGSTTLIRKRQLAASLDESALYYIQNWLSLKLQNQADFLGDLRKHRKQHRKFLDNKIQRITQLQQSIVSLKAKHINEVADTIRGLEGTAGRLYFAALSHVLPKHYHFAGRSFRPAKDAFNAFLNYGYGVLYSRVERSLMLAGIDGYVGFLHRDDFNFKSMVYDFIEPYRIFAEKVVFRLFSAKKVNKSHIEVLANGMRLNKEGKVLLIEALNIFLEENKIRYKGRNLCRNMTIQYDAHQFANELTGRADAFAIKVYD